MSCRTADNQRKLNRLFFLSGVNSLRTRVVWDQEILEMFESKPLFLQFTLYSRCKGVLERKRWLMFGDAGGDTVLQQICSRSAASVFGCVAAE